LRQALRTLRAADNPPGAIIHVSRLLEGERGLLGEIALAAGHKLRGYDLNAQIEELAGKGIVPAEIASDLHWIRVRANKARHNMEKAMLTARDGEVALDRALRIVEWFYCEWEKGPCAESIYTVERVRENRPDLGPLLPKTCDRRPQVREFGDFFQESLRLRPGAPQLCIIHGEERECHDSLIARLTEAEIRRIAEKKWGEHHGVVTFKKLVDWADEGTLEDRRQEMMRILFPAFDPSYSEQDLSAAALGGMVARQLSPVLVIQHNIHAKRWDPIAAALIRWYLAYWSEAASRSSGTQVIIFLSVIYPKLQASSRWRRWFGTGRFDKSRFQRELQQITESGNAEYPCLVLSELGPVGQEEIKNWFSKHNIHSEKTLYDLLERLFNAGGGRAMDRRCMADVEHELQDLVESIQQRYLTARGYL
jgi:hypothetical protein